ncbi:MAG: ubiquitin-like domain-containing protein [Carboxydocellales bacterium]
MDRLFTRKPAHPINTRKWVLIAVMFLLLLGAGGVTYASVNKSVNIKVAEQVVTVKTSGKTVADALVKAKITIGSKDVVTPGLTTTLSEGMKIEINRAKQVTINYDGNKQLVWTHGSTVQEVLNQANIKVGKLDQVVPSPQSAFKDQIVITRITEKVLEETITVPFGVERKSDSSMLRGVRKVVSRGSVGLNKRVVKVVYFDGKIVRREVLKTLTVRKPQNQVLAIGTVRTVSRGGGPLAFRESLVLEASGYTHTGHRTSTGRVTERGIAAVDPSVIPMGSRVYVDGYGYALAADRGSAIVGNRIDLFFETKAEALNWGRRNVRVYLLGE